MTDESFKKMFNVGHSTPKNKTTVKLGQINFEH